MIEVEYRKYNALRFNFGEIYFVDIDITWNDRIAKNRNQ